MSRQSQFREGSPRRWRLSSNSPSVLPPNGSTQRLPIRARILKPVVPLPSDTDIPRVRKQQGYAAISKRGPSPPSLLPPNRPMLDSKAGERALGHRPKADPRPNARPTGMTEPLRLSSIHQTLEGKQALSLRAQSFQQTSSVGQLGPPLELGSPRGRIQSNSNDADSARDSRPEGPKAQRALLRSFRQGRSTRESMSMSGHFLSYSS